jgi:hypothetical protein
VRTAAQPEFRGRWSVKRLFTSPGRLVAGAVSCRRSRPGRLQNPW